MSFSKYAVFVRVVELGSLTRAAEEFGYTQSAVSHILNALEEEIGLRLMTRGRAGICLTDSGERLLPMIRAILNDEEHLRQATAAIHGITLGTVRVATITSVAVHWLPGIIKSFRADYPQIEIRLFNGDYYDVENFLTDGSAEIGFVALPGPKGMETYPLKEDRLLAVLPTDHPLAGRAYLPMDALRTEPFISLLKESSHDALSVMRVNKIQPNVRYSTKDDYAIISMVESGLGISIMPELVLEGHQQKVCLLPLENPAHRVLALAVSKSASPAAVLFGEHVRKWVAENARGN